MSTNTYRIPSKSKREGGFFSTLERYFRIDQELTEVIHLRFLPQILFVSFLCVIYIGNRHYTEKRIRTISKLEVQVEDLRADFTTLKAEYMYASKQSEVARQAKSLGLVESGFSPYKIVVPRE